MIKQIKKRLTLGMLAIGLGLIPTAMLPTFSPVSVVSDVAEQKSVIDEQHFNLKENIVTPTPMVTSIPSPTPTPTKQPKIKKKYSGWVSATTLNVRKKPSKKSKVIGTLSFNKKISYYKIRNKKWVQIKYKRGFAYVSSQYISKNKMKYKQYEIPSYGGFKSWMPHSLRSGRSIFCKSSSQYKLQQRAYTGNYGIRMVDGRYCVAIGSHFATKIGTYFDLVLANEEIIPCILGDQKANKDTDSSNIFSTYAKCCSEFIVDRVNLNSKAKSSGNISSVDKKWNSRVKYIRVYK